MQNEKTGSGKDRALIKYKRSKIKDVLTLGAGSDRKIKTIANRFPRLLKRVIRLDLLMVSSLKNLPLPLFFKEGDYSSLCL